MQQKPVWITAEVRKADIPFGDRRAIFAGLQVLCQHFAPPVEGSIALLLLLWRAAISVKRSIAA